MRARPDSAGSGEPATASESALGSSGVVCGPAEHVFVPADVLDNSSARVCASCVAEAPRGQSSDCSS